MDASEFSDIFITIHEADDASNLVSEISQELRGTRDHVSH